MSANDRLRRGDAAFVAALAAGASVVAAAKAAGFSEATAHRRLKDAAIRKQIDDARDAILARAVAKLTGASTEAADTLRRLLYSESDFVRLAAAKAVLELGGKLREHNDYAERIQALEDRLPKEDTTWKPKVI